MPRGHVRITLPEAGQTLTVHVRHRCPIGHHDYGPEMWPAHDEFVVALLTQLTALTGWNGATLSHQIADSEARTARYLTRGRPAISTGDPHAITRHAEQNVHFGHPFHPTPKSTEGFSDDDLEHYAPELATSFVPHYWAVARELLREVRVADGAWVPTEVAAAVPTGYEALPAHPWQARYLLARPEVAALVATGGLVSLGPLGRPVYPTASVRTVCDPGFPTSWKLPLHVRITNFVRTNPVEHLRRAAAASALAGQLPRHAGFGVLRETGYRTLDPAAVGDALAAEFAVLYRENPFAAERTHPPMVLAGLLDDPAGLADRIAGDATEWLRRYLEISLVPLFALFESDGVALEAHVQNSLLCLDDGVPVRFWVRDLEGAAVSRDRLRQPVRADGEPLLYDDATAWLRLRYHAVTNQLGHVVHALGVATGRDETELWSVARETLHGRRGTGPLLASPTLPAKTNLISRFTGRGEQPSYVDIPNPLWEP